MKRRVMRALVHVMGVLMIAAFCLVVPLFLVAGCAPQPTTKVNLGTGMLESPKDWKAKLIQVDSTDPDGTQKHVRIEGLDASASSVISAQAEAMKAQAEAFKAAGEALGAMAEKVGVGVTRGAMGPVP